MPSSADKKIAVVHGYIGTLSGMEHVFREIGWVPEANASKRLQDKLARRAEDLSEPDSHDEIAATLDVPAIG